MSGATPTLIPSESIFPRLLPKPPQPHPMPLVRRRIYNSINAINSVNTVRDFQREMDDLSDEENEVEDLNNVIHNRGFAFLVPIGRSLTRQEEKNDAEDDSDDTGSLGSGQGGEPSVLEDEGENDSAQDLDASMEDLDEDVTIDSDNDEPTEGETDEFEEETSGLL